MGPLIPRDGWHPLRSIHQAFQEDTTLWVPVVSGTLGMLAISLCMVFCEDEPGTPPAPCPVIVLDDVTYKAAGC